MNEKPPKIGQIFRQCPHIMCSHSEMWRAVAIPIQSLESTIGLIALYSVGLFMWNLVRVRQTVRKEINVFQFHVKWRNSAVPRSLASDDHWSLMHSARSRVIIRLAIIVIINYYYYRTTVTIASILVFF